MGKFGRKQQEKQRAVSPPLSAVIIQLSPSPVPGCGFGGKAFKWTLMPLKAC